MAKYKQVCTYWYLIAGAPFDLLSVSEGDTLLGQTEVDAKQKDIRSERLIGRETYKLFSLVNEGT